MGKFDHLLIKDSDSDSSVELTHPSLTRKEANAGSAPYVSIPVGISVVPVVMPTTALSTGRPSVHEGLAFPHEVDPRELEADPGGIKSSSQKNSVPRTTESLHEFHHSVSKSSLRESTMPVAPSIRRRRKVSSRNGKSLPKLDNIMDSTSLVGGTDTISPKLSRRGTGKPAPVDAFQMHSNIVEDDASDHLRPPSEIDTDEVELTMDSKLLDHVPDDQSSLVGSGRVSFCKVNPIAPVSNKAENLPLETLPIRRPSSPQVYDCVPISEHLEAESPSFIVPSRMNEDSAHTAAAASGDWDESQIIFSSYGQETYAPPPSATEKRDKARSGCGIFSFCSRRAAQTELEERDRLDVSTPLDDPVGVSQFDPHFDLPQSAEGDLADALDNALPHHSPAGMPVDEPIHNIYATEEQPSRTLAPIQEEKVHSGSMEQLSSAHLPVGDKLSPINQFNNHTPNMSPQISTSVPLERGHHQQTSCKETVPIPPPNFQDGTNIHTHAVHHNRGNSTSSEKGTPVEKAERPSTIQPNDAVSREGSSGSLSSSGNESGDNCKSFDSLRCAAPQSADQPVSLTAHCDPVCEAATTPHDGSSRAVVLPPSAPDDLTPSETDMCPKISSKSSSVGLFFCTGSPLNSKGSIAGPSVACATKAPETWIKEATYQMGITTEAHYLNSSGKSTPLTNEEHQVEYDGPDDLANLPPYQRRILLDLREAERRELEEFAKGWRDLTFRPQINKCPTQILECTKPFSERLSKPRQQRSPIPFSTPVTKSTTSHKLREPHRQRAENGISPPPQSPSVFSRLARQHSPTNTHLLQGQSHKGYTHTPEISDLAKQRVSSLGVVARLYPQPPKAHRGNGENVSPQRVARVASAPGCSGSVGVAIISHDERKSVFERLYRQRKPSEALSQTSQPIRRLHVVHETGLGETAQYQNGYDEHINNDDGIVRQLYIRNRRSQGCSYHMPFYPSDTSSTT